MHTGLVPNLGPVPLVPWGTTQSFNKKQHNEKASNSMTFGCRSVHHALKSIRKHAKGVKFQLRCKVLLEKFSFENDRVITIDVWFPAETRTLTV